MNKQASCHEANNLRSLALMYLSWLGVANPAESLEKDLRDPQMVASQSTKGTPNAEPITGFAKLEAANVCGAGAGCCYQAVEIDRLRERVEALESALELIAAPMRPDGTWNRDRMACQQLAFGVLARQTGDGKP